MSRAIVFLLVAALAYGVPPAAAQPADPGNIVQTINLFGVQVAYPAPSWARTANPMADSEFYRDQKGSSFILEQIPKGEKFERWNRLYAVMAQRIPGMPLREFVRQSLGPFAAACPRENFSVVALQQQADAITVRILCRDSPADAAKFGARDGFGEVTLMRIGEVGGTFVKVYQHWRGKRFNPDDMATWPAPTAEYETMVRRFAGIRMSGS